MRFFKYIAIIVVSAVVSNYVKHQIIDVNQEPELVSTIDKELLFYENLLYKFENSTIESAGFVGLLSNLKEKEYPDLIVDNKTLRCSKRDGYQICHHWYNDNHFLKFKIVKYSINPLLYKSAIDDFFLVYLSEGENEIYLYGVSGPSVIELTKSVDLFI